MGIFHVELRIEHMTRRANGATLRRAMVDTGAEFTWVPETVLEQIGVKREKKDVEFQMANGQVITRSVGFAIVRVGEYFTIDEVVFAEKGDQTWLGARSLEGLNLMVDSGCKRLVAAGPSPAA
jgi:predicted aspartyl protease